MNLKFYHLPAFAKWLLEHKLKEYCTLVMNESRRIDLPILKYFSHLTDEQLIAMSLDRNSEMFGFMIRNEADKYIADSTRNWITNQLPMIQRDQVAAEDIILVNAVRRKIWRTLSLEYTNDIMLFANITEEIDQFTIAMDTSLFKTFFELQVEQINSINSALQRREVELLEAQEIGQIGSFEWDLIGKDSKFTPQVYRIFEIEQTSSIQSFLDDVHPEDREKVLASIKEGLSTGSYECEYRYVRNKKEKIIWSRAKVSYKGDTPVKMIGTISDVTERNKIIEQLQHSENLHKQAQSLTHIGNWSLDIDLNEVSWSDEMYRIFGLEPQSEKISLARFLSFVHPEDVKQYLSYIQQSLQTLEVQEYFFRIISRDGKTKVLRGRGEVRTDRSKKPLELMGTCQDVTNEFTLNNELREREIYLNQLLENAPDAIIVINEHSEIILWNPKTEVIFGWKASEAIGKDLTSMIIPAQHREPHKQGMARLLATGEAHVLNKTIEIQALNKTGNEFYIALTISQSVQAEQPIFIAFIRDITEDKKIKSELTTKTLQLAAANYSLELKNQELERINKELESFNFIASHDLQEPLRKIRLYSNRMQDALTGLPDQVKTYADKINTASERMQVLITDFLSFAKTVAAPPIFESTDLMSVLQETKNELAGAIEEKHVTIVSTPLPVIDAIPFQIHQLMVNLIGNAIKYSKENIDPNITITSSLVSGVDIKDQNAPPTKKYVKLIIADNGIGFEQQYALKIFELFQRLHNRDKYSGTGIGLAICKKIVDNHQGFISAISEPGVGTQFIIYLPIVLK